MQLEITLAIQLYGILQQDIGRKSCIPSAPSFLGTKVTEVESACHCMKAVEKKSLVAAIKLAPTIPEEVRGVTIRCRAFTTIHREGGGLNFFPNNLAVQKRSVFPIREEISSIVGQWTEA